MQLVKIKYPPMDYSKYKTNNKRILSNSMLPNMEVGLYKNQIFRLKTNMEE